MEKMQRFARRSYGDILTKLPLVELAGQNRVLIENHQGVLAYSTKEIQIKVCYGCISIRGEELQLLEMSRIQLVICGRIDGLQVFRR